MKTYVLLHIYVTCVHVPKWGGGAENAGVENAGAIKYGKPSE